MEDKPLPPTVSIKRAGNLLSVTPHMYSLLGPVLTYKHRHIRYGVSSASRSSGMSVRSRQLYRIDGNSLYTTQGAFKRITDTLIAAHIPYTFEDLRKKQVLEPDYEHLALCMPGLKFRLKQDEVLAHLIAENSGVIVAPTAYGKTFIMLAIAALYPHANIIMASPSSSLLRGAYRRMLAITTDVGRIGGGYKEQARVTLCTFKSIMNAPVKECDILLLDESHRTPAREISTNISRIRSPVKIFGMTATPTGRSDGSELAAEVLIGPVIYRISYQEAAENGLVANLRVLMIDLDDCAPSSGNYKTKVAKQRNCYWRNVKRNQLIAAAIKEMPKLPSLPDDPQMLILTATIDHAFRIRQYLPDFEVVYASLSKAKLNDLKSAGVVEEDYVALTAKKRDELLKGFEQGTIRRAIATGCWGEGVDFVHLDALAIAAGQYSSIDTEQWAGRNSRIYSGKQHGIVIDVMDQWDPWTYSRAKQRMRVYKSKGWAIEKFGKYIEQAHSELPLQEAMDA